MFCYMHGGLYIIDMIVGQGHDTITGHGQRLFEVLYWWQIMVRTQNLALYALWP